MNCINNDVLDMALIAELTKRPRIFEKTADFIWTDGHVGESMLALHLNPDLDAASRKPATIAGQVEWICARVPDPQGLSLLDIGCGPGLYCEQFAGKGFHVTGMDFNRVSLEYARRSAEDRGLAVEYRYQDYRTLDVRETFDVVTLINCDFSALIPVDRDTVLANVFRALKPGGLFVFDAFSRDFAEDRADVTSFSCTTDADFWSAKPHMLIEQHLVYPEANTLLEKYVLVEDDGTTKNFHNWLIAYDGKDLGGLLDSVGFTVVAKNPLLSDVSVEDPAWFLGFAAVKT